MAAAQTAEQLMLQIQSGDMQALEELFQLLRSAVYCMHYMLTASHSDADDLTQDTFLRVWEWAAAYHSGGSARAWVMAVGRNLALDFLRRRKKCVELAEELPVGVCSAQVLDSMLLQQLLAHLTPGEREIVVMYAYGFSHKEISEIFGRSYSSVRKLYSLAIRRLQAAAQVPTPNEAKQKGAGSYDGARNFVTDPVGN